MVEDEMFILDQLATAKALAVDVGANRGYYTYFLSRIFDRVEAFEPNSEILRDLRDYSAPNITIHEIALSSRVGIRSLHIPLVNGIEYSGWASFSRENLQSAHSVRTIQVKTVTLDSLKLASVALIKIDAEGHEMEILNGARETICASRPVVIIEINRSHRAQAEVFFNEMNYKFFVFEAGAVRALNDGLEGYLGLKATFIVKPG